MMILIFLLMIELACCVESEKQYLVAVDKLNVRNLDAILHALKDYGKAMKPGDVKDSVMQYTCTTVLSEEEINDLASWFHGNKFPNSFTNRRIKVQYNTKEEHGEKIVLREHLDRLIEQMQEDSRKIGHNIYPVVIMYSYNIPCSIQSHECARLLNEDKKKRMNTKNAYTLVIGFSLFFQFRGDKDRNIQNRQMSFKNLAIEGIQVRKMFNIFKNKEFTSLVLGEQHIEGAISFQSVIYSCLIEQPTLYTCSTDLSNINKNEVKRIFSFSINKMFFECQSVSLNYQSKGVFKGSDLYNCLMEWISKSIGKDCDGPNLQKIWKHFLEESIRQGREMATFIGVPRGLYLDEPQWVRAPLMKWVETPDDFLRNRNIQCNKGNLDPASFCTTCATKRHNIEPIKRTPKPMVGQHAYKLAKTKDESRSRNLV